MISVAYMLHVNLLRWPNLIGSLAPDIGQYPIIEFSNSVASSRKKNQIIR